MKRIFSLMMAVLTVASVLAIPSFAEEGYTGMSVVEVEAYAFEKQPEFDGSISADEWGEFTVEANGTDAATVDAVTNNYMNSLFRWDYGDGISAQLSYKIWFRWDAQYFYVGAQVKDPDGYTNANNRTGIWNGDCFQFRVDPVGPNGIMTFNDESYDYKTTAFNYNKYQVPWSDPNGLMNVGCAVYPGQKRPFQVYDMANQLLTNGDRADVETRSLVGITPASAETDGVTTYEIAMPWELIFVFDYDKFVPVDPETNLSHQVYAGKVLGVSATVLNAAEGAENFNSFLAWGSGCCGAQHQKDAAHFPYVNGGSNAVILSDKNATDPSKTVAVPQENPDGPVIEFAEQAIYASAATEGHYFGINYPHPAAGAVVEMDIAPLAMNATAEASMIGFIFGNNGEGGFYSLMAGYDMVGKTFVIADNNWQEGFKNADSVLVRGEKQYDWAVADPDNGVAAQWHRLGIKVDNATDTVTLYLDGEVVLTWTDPRVHNYDDSAASDDDATKEIIPYSTVERFLDNLFYGTADYEIGVSPRTAENTLADYTFDTTDTVFQKSKTYANLGTGGFKLTELKCNDTENAYGCCGHNLNKIVAANSAKIVYGCYYCDDASLQYAVDNNGQYAGDVLNGDHELLGGEGDPDPTPDPDPEPTPEPVPGDANGDGKANMKDAIAICKHVADWPDVIADAAAADITGDGKVNVKDAAAILKMIAES